MATRKKATRYRGWVMENLKPLLPRGWVLSPYARIPQTVEKTTVIVWLQNITRLPESPLSSHVTEYLVTVVSPAADPAQGDEDLDDSIADLLHAIDQSPNTISWERAERATYADTNVAFDITVRVITTSTPDKE